MGLGQPAVARRSMCTTQPARPHPPQRVHRAIHAPCGWRPNAPHLIPALPQNRPPHTWTDHPHHPPHLSTSRASYPQSYPQDMRHDPTTIVALLDAEVMHTGPDLSTVYGHLSTISRIHRLPATALPLPAKAGRGRRRGAGTCVSTACVDNSPVVWINAMAQAALSCQRPRRLPAGSRNVAIHSVPSGYGALTTAPPWASIRCSVSSILST